MSYRGPNRARIRAQHSVIQDYAAETATWCAYLTATTGTGSAYLGGGGTTPTYAERTISAFFAAPQMGEARFREYLLPGGQVMAGDVVISTVTALGAQDEIQWRGVTYRVEGDSTPVHLGGRPLWRTLLRRGDSTG